jgi:hypothetical protein
LALEEGILSCFCLLNVLQDHAYKLGDRVCPGQYLGTASVWISIASMLATFRISKELDKNGNEITPTPGMTTGLERYGS